MNRGSVVSSEKSETFFNADQQYTVINDALIRECIKLRKMEDDFYAHDDKKLNMHDVKREKMEFSQIDYLKFSAKYIYRISNLEGFHNLKTLQLDNNKISRIENLSHLKNLERLDLSFNNISRIENLNGLTMLKDLSLFNNKIEKIENLDDLVNLECLSVAKNKIEERENIRYLRNFEKLNSLTIYDNPVCEKKYIKPYMIAFLKNLKFLDYRLIQPNELKDALDRYNGELQELDDKEKQVSRNTILDEKKMQEKAELEAANVSGIDELFDAMFAADEEYKNIKLFDYCLGEYFEKYKKSWIETAEEFKTAMKAILAKKNNEIEEIESFMNQSTYENDNLSKNMIRDFDRKKKRIIAALHVSEETDEEAYSAFENLKSELDELCRKLVEIEVNQTEYLADNIDDFNQNYKEMDASTTIQTYIKKLKKLEDTYSSEIKQRLMQEADSKHDENVSEQIKDFLEDKDIISRSLQSSNDVHKDLIDRKEEELLKEERKRMDGKQISIKEDEHTRNRSRINEIWSYVDRIEQELREEREQFEPVDPTL